MVIQKRWQPQLVRFYESIFCLAELTPTTTFMEAIVNDFNTLKESDEGCTSRN